MATELSVVAAIRLVAVMAAQLVRLQTAWWSAALSAHSPPASRAKPVPAMLLEEGSEGVEEAGQVGGGLNAE